MPFRSGADEDDVAGFRQHDDVAAGDDGLTISVAAAFPLQLACRRVDARKDRFVETVEISLVQQRAGELVFHPRVCPDRARREAVAIALDLEHPRTLGIARRQEHAVVAENHGLRHVDALAGRPRILP